MSGSADPFEIFLEGWVVRQEHYLEELISARNCNGVCEQDYLVELVSRVFAHYEEYYQEKSRAMERDIFGLFSPAWFTSLEKSLLWMAGFKPGLVFGILLDSVEGLAEEQRLSVRELRDETKGREKRLAEEMAGIQESIAQPPLMPEGRGKRRTRDDALNLLGSEMGKVVARADSLRKDTVSRLMGLLNPTQCVQFLAAASGLQLRIREWGLIKDAQRHNSD